MLPLDWHLSNSVGYFLDLRFQWVGQHTGQVVLGSSRKTEEARGSKSVSSTPPRPPQSAPPSASRLSPWPDFPDDELMTDGI